MKLGMIYLDHAATTPLDPDVLAKMQPFLAEKFANAGGIYAAGQQSRHAVDEARQTVAGALECSPQEIIFTSGGTESDNLALRGVMTREKTGHLITTVTEHHAILHTAEELEKDGYDVTILPVDETGRVTVEAVEAAIRPDTKLISVMLANNEIGTLNPVREIGKMLEKRRERGKHAPLLHTDAVQGGGVLDLDVRHLKVDLLSLSAHKFYGPKGVGILFRKNGVKLRGVQTGGGQEYRLRAGTENVPGIVGCGQALKIAEEKRETESARQAELRDYFIEQVEQKFEKVRLNGHRTERLPGNVNFSFFGIEGESILLRLDFDGIAASSGSACTSGSLDPSHVLIACGLSHEWAHGSLRLTFGRDTTRQLLDIVIEKLEKIVADLRRLSPIKI